MASRKDEKQQRRAERLEAEAAAAGEARRKKLLTAVGATALAAVVVVVALILVSQSGDDNSGNASEISSDLPVLASIDSLEQAGNTVGDPNAKVTIYEFGDLQCPACKEFSESVIPELLAAEGPVGAGEAQLAFENFVIIGDESVDAAKAALAAGGARRGIRSRVRAETDVTRGGRYQRQARFRQTALAIAARATARWS
jgi:protein-disulfide isomerase